MLIKQTKEMTEAERLAAQNSNNQFLQALAYSAVGTIFPYAGESAPDTFMLCDGSELNVAEYAELFSVIGYKFGGSEDVFKLPDLRGKTLVGIDATNQKFDTIGKEGGEDEVTLTVETMPNHSHVLVWDNEGAAASGSGSGVLMKPQDSDTLYAYRSGDAGEGKPHNNMPPFTIVNYIIKVIQSVPEMKLRFPIDQTYNPESENPQSGVAVAEAISGKADVENWELLHDITLTEDVTEVRSTVKCKKIYCEMLAKKTTNYTNGATVTIFFQPVNSDTGSYRGVSCSSTYNTTTGLLAFQGAMEISPSGRIDASGRIVGAAYGYGQNLMVSTLTQNFASNGKIETVDVRSNGLGIGTNIKIWGVRA